MFSCFMKNVQVCTIYCRFTYRSYKFRHYSWYRHEMDTADLLRTLVLVLHLILSEIYVNKCCLYLEDLLPHYMSGAFTIEAND